MLPAAFHPPVKHNITGCILAGGRGSRMGGADKGLQMFRGQTLVQHAIMRLQPQVSQVLINANRNPADYALTGCKVIADTDFADMGPLSGFLTGLQHCDTEWLVTVPCDSPFFPLDLVEKLAAAATAKQSLIAMVQTPRSSDNTWELQPVFCLMHRSLIHSLKDYLASGQRKISAWAQQQTPLALCEFEETAESAHPFANANTLQELQNLQS
jgi:molybdopterin-guanine dinucleotide biosynthesis protein A